MEDVAKALEMAAAMLIFIIAISIAFFVINKAKSTSDIVFAASDVSTFYEYVSEDNAPNAEITREVSTETIIPTLYRYNNEPLRIIITDGNKIVQVFDTAMDRDIEIIWREYDHIQPNSNSITNSYRKSVLEDMKTRLPELNLMNELLGTNYTPNELIKAYIDSYKKNVVQNSAYIIPWNTNERINKRVDLFVGGVDATDNEINGTILKDGNGFFETYKGDTFEERFIKYKTSGEVTEEGTVLSEGEDKTIIIYTKK